MPLHLTKIAFQSESPATLKAWLESHADEARLTTRYLPKRLEEMDGGSLYWVVKGTVVCRQPILDIATLGEGKASRCEIRLDSQVIRTAPLARRPFQGWRYFEPKDAPPDLSVAEATDLPDDLARELRELGAW